MKMSESISELAPALVKAQAEIKTIAKDSTNPHFKNRYASLDGIMESVRPILTSHGLAILQGVTVPETDGGRLVGFTVETMLVHTSGQYVTNSTPMPVQKSDAQGAGGALTYGRRYGVSALLALATDEDDGGNAGRPKARPDTPRNDPPTNDDAPTDKQVGFLGKLLKSHVFSDDERTRITRKATTRAQCKAAIDYVQAEIAKRESAEKEAA